MSIPPPGAADDPVDEPASAAHEPAAEVLTWRARALRTLPDTRV